MRQDTLAIHTLITTTGHLRALDSRIEAQAVLCFALIAAHPGIAMSDLAERLGLTLGGTSRNISKLCDVGNGLGLVSREEDPVDRRLKRMRLTERGERFCRDLGGALAAITPPREWR
ncbi:DNA-binding MarR family transcriptional regulator [Natronocella acetinitrilica]|uniref:DNA-binding MarR family transcriptional regulator n=1 Tax=Natronocella acetinitrilica TaxID=414046 RepID=A0AAE3KAK7_9GAMM|nr:MarR family transcriptional regulator [Natronocella acetinitrilica]MCP1674450.1 DNA-binding MarR family transcriptional regulator [Natronocella acetinitrilica]